MSNRLDELLKAAKQAEEKERQYTRLLPDKIREWTPLQEEQVKQLKDERRRARNPKMSQVFASEEFPELFEAYPDLKDVNVQLEPTLFDSSVSAAYDPVNNRMTLYVPEEMSADNPSLDLSESLLHEIQHYIQNTEFQNGAYEKLNAPRGFIPPRLREFANSRAARNAESPMRKAYKNIDEFNRTHIEDSALEAMDKKYPTNRLGWYDETFSIPENIDRGYMHYRRDNRYETPLDAEDILEFLQKEENPAAQMTLDMAGLSEDTLDDFASEELTAILRDYKDRGGIVDNDKLIEILNGVEPYVSNQYVYKMNPFEREAFEASKRDVNPQYRKMYKRKTEHLRDRIPFTDYEIDLNDILDSTE